MNELTIVINQQQGTIVTNFEEIKESLTRQMEIYNELEVTDGNKIERKKDVASLRKMTKSITEKRTEVRNECLKPFLAFDEKANELIEIINKPIHIIDVQVKNFEEAQKELKRAEITNIFNSLIGDLVENVTLYNIQDSKWENATVSIKSVKDEMTEKINTIRQNAIVIGSMVSDKTDEALEMFWDDLDLGKAVSMITRYEQQKKEIQARLEEQQRVAKEREIERQRVEKEREVERQRLAHEREIEAIKKQAADDERAKIRQEEQIREQARIDAQAEQQAILRAEQEAMVVYKQETKATNETYMYTITATDEEIEQVEMYLNSLGLDWAEIK